MTALAEASHVDASVVSRQAAHLEQEGLVERSPDPDDGRAHRLSLTASGREALQRGRDRFAVILTERLSGWDAEELETVSGTLRRLLDDLTTPTTSAEDPTHE